ncbi:MAG TPA: hypothetical protein VKH46_11970 [Thermoanaerobaculia bacterium]|jgi:hypothetical protein|nr:hypothetical protein [Thermoanaerobaculia bacterium]
MRNRLLIGIGLLGAGIAACRRAQPAREIPMAPSHVEEGEGPAAPVSADLETGPVRVAGIAFAPPAAWRREAPASAMRAAQFAIPGSAGEKDGAVAVYYFGSGQGGGIAANAKRWQEQFSGQSSPGTVTSLDKNGVKVTVVTAEGTYASGMPMGPSTPEPGFALWGAIIEAPQGNVFVKATGPKSLIERSRSDFDALLSSLQTSTSM